MIRVMCVDDNPDIVEAVRIRLSREDGYEWVGALASADDLLAVTNQRKPDVVLLDVDMPGRDPFEVVREVTAGAPTARVVILSGYVRKDLVNRAIVAGAWGYIAKGDGERALVEAIEQVTSGEFAMSAEVRTVYAL